MNYRDYIEFGVLKINGGLKSATETLTASTTLTANQSGNIIFIGTDAIVATLPATAAGLRYTFVNSGTDGNNIMTIDPNASDAIHGTATLAATVVVFGGVDGVTIVNTKATSTTGDSITLVGDGVAGWYVESSTGIWATGA